MRGRAADSKESAKQAKQDGENKEAAKERHESQIGIERLRRRLVPVREAFPVQGRFPDLRLGIPCACDAMDTEVPCGKVVPAMNKPMGVDGMNFDWDSRKDAGAGVVGHCGGQDSNLGTPAGRDPKSRAVSELGYRRAAPKSA